jgi:hypothetical protein
MKPTMLIACLALAACGETAQQEESAAKEEHDSVFDPMTDQIDKAKAVEDAALRHKQEIDDALREVDEPTERSGDDQ